MLFVAYTFEVHLVDQETLGLSSLGHINTAWYLRKISGSRAGHGAIPKLDLPRQPTTGGNPLVLLRLLVHRSGLCTDSAEGTIRGHVLLDNESGNNISMYGQIRGRRESRCIYNETYSAYLHIRIIESCVCSLCIPVHSFTLTMLQYFMYTHKRWYCRGILTWPRWSGSTGMRR